MRLKTADKISGRMKNVIKVSTGTLAGQIVMFISLPLLTRMYGVEIVGVSTLITSFAAIVNAISDLGMTNSLMLEEKEQKASHIYEVISTISLGISLAAALVIMGYNYFFSLDLGINPIFATFYIFLTFFLLKQSQICYTWLTKKQQYSLLMKNPLINSISYTGIAFVLGWLGFFKYGYYIGTLVGWTLAILIMKYHLPKKMFSGNMAKYKEVIQEHPNFIRYEMPNNILAQIKTQLPVLLIKIFFNNQILGYYSLSVKILNIPINLLANAMGRVFFQVASDAKDDIKKVREFTYRNINKAMKLVIVPMSLLIGFGDIIVLLLFGKGFEMAGSILQIVAFQSYIVFISLTVQGVYTIIGKQKWSMISLISQIVFILIFFSIGVLVFDSIYIALGFMSIVVVVVYIIYYCAIFNYMGISPRKFVSNAVSSMIAIFIFSTIIRMMIELTDALTYVEKIIK